MKGVPYSSEDPRFGPWLVSVVEFCDEIVHFLQAHDGHPLHSLSDRIVCNSDGATVYYWEGIPADGFSPRRTSANEPASDSAPST